MLYWKLSLYVTVVFVNTELATPTRTIKPTSNRITYQKETKHASSAKPSLLTSQPSSARPSRTMRQNTTKKATISKIKPTTKIKKTTLGEPTKKKTTKNTKDRAKAHPMYVESTKKLVKEMNQSLHNVNMTMTMTTEFVQDFVMNASIMLLKDSEKPTKNKTKSTSFKVMEMLYILADMVSSKLGEPTGQEVEMMAIGYNVVFSVKNTKTTNFTGYSFPNMDMMMTMMNDTKLAENNIRLPKDFFNFSGSNASYAKIVSFAYDPVRPMKKGASARNTRLVDKIVSTSVDPPLNRKLNDENRVYLTFRNDLDKNSNQICSYWNYSANSWMENGCRLELKQSNNTFTVCSCNHLTDFSVLMRIKERSISEHHRAAMHWISVVGCSISISFLFFLMLIVMCIRKLRHEIRYKIHLNLAISLIIGNITLLFADHANTNEDACLGVSVLMFYIYLVAFFWMFCEGIFIWRGLVHVFSQNDKFWWYMLFSWGTPMIIVGITGGVVRRNLISNDSCWLSWEQYAIWGFVGPALIIILLNTIILIKALSITVKHVSDHQNGLKITARMTLFLVPLFGSTWVFGVFAVNDETLVFQYLFTVLNSLRGLFIFIFYIGCSLEVRKEISKTEMVNILSTFSACGGRQSTSTSSTHDSSITNIYTSSM